MNLCFVVCLYPHMNLLGCPEEISSDDSQCIPSPTDELCSKDIEPIENANLNDTEAFERIEKLIKESQTKIDENVSISTGLRKTDYSDNLYSTTTSPKKVNSKIPLSPMTRRRSIDSATISNEPITGKGNVTFARHSPTYRSVRKSQVKEPIKNLSTIENTKKVNGTWSGRLGIKKRPSVETDTFKKNNNNNITSNGKNERNSRQIIKSKNSSPIKSSSAAIAVAAAASQSPLAQKIVEMAENVQCDEQMLEKMKELLSKYSTTAKINTKNSPSRSARSSSTSSPAKNHDDYEDFTTAWVNSNGSLDRGSACCSPTKSQSKRSSAASSMDSNSYGKEQVISIRRDRGTTRIPAPVRHNTDLY